MNHCEREQYYKILKGHYSLVCLVMIQERVQDLRKGGAEPNVCEAHAQNF